MKGAQINLDCAVVAITGGGRGIGLATARLFAEHGAVVCIGDLDGAAAADGAASIGPRAHAFTVDVASRESFDAFVAGVERAAGLVDVLINNAGIMPVGRFVDESPEATEKIFAVNVHGPINGMQIVLPGMIERRRGHVVNVASMLGKTELPGLATYTASKHAVVGLGAAVRAELAGTGVTLSTVLPSIVNTELASGIDLGFGKLIRVEPEDIAAAILGTLAGRPKEVPVPHLLGLYPVLRPFVPESIENVVRGRIGHDRAITGVEGARAAYEQRAAAQPTRNTQASGKKAGDR
jgi:NAD(P)-dependent dehydrogenase (short-subunit alcohol dehydrogenase family)